MLMPRPTKLSADEEAALERLKQAAGRPMDEERASGAAYFVGLRPPAKQQHHHA